MRVGTGYDCHRFGDGDHVFIGGVKIPFDKGVIAHSDGDVLLHAIGDALLGALALGDLGQHFPDTDPSIESVASSRLLADIMKLVAERNYRVINVDSTVIAERPRLVKHSQEMRANIAELLGISLEQVSVKATTNEKMGWVGREEGLAATATVLLSTT
ncbi:MAG: 2-C-methyl-D-erythritol 2,4-cyclodiphosphate synthase [Gammaproteobacteria bacterium]|nr:2-C-methyl-D-erythritol 2,4-cyclodiphosphate synthase [Gammaproteobacteria bacterium]MCH9743912.1 2-C-methyl-D-erythritol 2,4-cyclodiphosphate synthase [Gammaproteobacteria bacterium]